MTSDIGTGNFGNTNYPDDPLSDPLPARETNDFGGGRVFKHIHRPRR